MVVEASLVVSVECLVDTGGVCAHVGHQVVVGGDAASPCDAVSRRVLLRCNHSTCNVHRVGVHHWLNSTRCLGWVEEGDTSVATNLGVVQNLDRQH